MTETLLSLVLRVPLAASAGLLTGPPSGVLALVALVALLLAAAALTRSVSAVCALIADLLRSLFATVGALALIGLVFVCIVMLALAGAGEAVPPTGAG